MLTSPNIVHRGLGGRRTAKFYVCWLYYCWTPPRRARLVIRISRYGNAEYKEVGATREESKPLPVP